MVASPTRAVLLRAGLLGWATGGRSLIGGAALAVTNPAAGTAAGSWLDRRATTRVAVLASASEFVGDKLPMTPSRLQPQGLIPRLVLGGLGGAVLTHREGHSTAVAAAAAGLGAVGAFVGAHAGATWRRVGAARLGRDLPAALVEDAVVLAAAAVATRGSVRPGPSEFEAFPN
jgi:uncharacterized membrane protein